MLDNINSLQEIDCVLSVILDSGGNKDNISVGAVQSNAALDMQDTMLPGMDEYLLYWEGAENGQEVYDFWMKLVDIATLRAKSCTDLYNESANKVIDLENKKNNCYLQGDALKKQRDEAQANKVGLEAKVNQLQRDIGSLKSDIAALEEKVESLKSKKEVYDILRYIPFINAFSEIIAAIEGTRQEFSDKKNQLEKRQEDYEKLCLQWNQSNEKIEQLIAAISENERASQILDEQIKVYLTQREQSAKEMIAWKEREQYYLNIAGEMKHLIALKADVDKFKQLVIDNPPPFVLVR